MDRKTKYQVWKKRMEDYEVSGQSILDWVSSYKDDITVHQFYYWRKKFNSENKGMDQNSQNGWTSFDFQADPTTSNIEVRINDMSVYIPENANDDHIHRVFRVLRDV